MKEKAILYIAIALGAVAVLFGGYKLMLRIKEGANVKDLSMEMKDALNIIDDVFQSYGLVGVVTSGKDSIHRVINSYHYTGDAVDLRLPSRLDTATSDKAVKTSLAVALGPDYDVILESDHIHVEFDRKRAMA